MVNGEGNYKMPPKILVKQHNAFKFIFICSKGTKQLKIYYTKSCTIENYREISSTRHDEGLNEILQVFNWLLSNPGESKKFLTSCCQIQAQHQYAPDLNYAICLKRPQSACQVNFRKKEKKKINKKSTKEKLTAV